MSFGKGLICDIILVRNRTISLETVLMICRFGFLWQKRKSFNKGKISG